MLQSSNQHLSTTDSPFISSNPSASKTLYKRGHAHKRSAAISGDFDLDFFKGSSINEQLCSVSTTQELDFREPPRIFTPSNSSTSPKTPKVNIQSSPVLQSQSIPKLIITQTFASSKCLTSSPSDTRYSSSYSHNRISSWAYSTQSHNKRPSPKSLKIDHESTREPSSSSSTDSTPEGKNHSVTSSRNIYEIPEATIDLDVALGVYHDPASINPRFVSKTHHRRTESAPELEDFLKYKVFTSEYLSTTTNSPIKNNAASTAIFEEEEEEGENSHEILSASSSSSSSLANMQMKTLLNKNPSTHSLASNNSLASSNGAANNYPIVSTPTSTKSSTRRGGASAIRYQSYYNNNILLSNALKSSDSINIVGNKPSISSLEKYLPQQQSTSHGNSGFQFQSRVYDMPTKDSLSSSSVYNSPKVSSSTPIKKSHKKSNSLLNSISSRIRRNSISSNNTKNEDKEDKEKIDEFDADVTLTPFNVGEPGPELDLTTMTPKLSQTASFFNTGKSPSKSEKKKAKKKLFGWMKK
ncbi:hypothetical protein WICMUC_005294 [Wickerhamomyces mucosus]|uniref:Uncharacterized protein n=1 Tax=Wickerhamomyces mucosus TaxID=1378264 RepID=A0A9P8P9H1_9ASCO|nr:hypothetical protein WICMUC_005294 [Wickerhamomyces mucosus]